MDQARVDLLTRQRQIARADGVDLKGRIAGGLAAVHVRESGAVDDGVGLVAADVVDGGLTVRDVQLIDIHRDNGGLAQALGQRADGAALRGKLVLQLGAQLPAQPVIRIFMRIPLLYQYCSLSSATFFRCWP